MNILFLCSIDGTKKYGKDFLRVLEILKNTNDGAVFSKITHEDYAAFRKKFGAKGDPKINTIIDQLEKNKEVTNVAASLFESTKRAISWTDATVIDNSHSSFRLGNEATIAVQNRKPVLVLSQNKDYSKLIDTAYFYGAKYTMYNVREIIKDFIGKAQKQVLKNRFNLMLSDEHKELLEVMSLQKSVSQAEILRDLLEKAQQ